MKTIMIGLLGLLVTVTSYSEEQSGFSAGFKYIAGGSHHDFDAITKVAEEKYQVIKEVLEDSFIGNYCFGEGYTGPYLVKIHSAYEASVKVNYKGISRQVFYDFFEDELKGELWSSAGINAFITRAP